MEGRTMLLMVLGLAIVTMVAATPMSRSKRSATAAAADPAHPTEEETHHKLEMDLMHAMDHKIDDIVTEVHAIHELEKKEHDNDHHEIHVHVNDHDDHKADRATHVHIHVNDDEHHEKPHTDAEAHAEDDSHANDAHAEDSHAEDSHAEDSHADDAKDEVHVDGAVEHAA